MCVALCALDRKTTANSTWQYFTFKNLFADSWVCALPGNKLCFNRLQMKINTRSQYSEAVLFKLFGRFFTHMDNEGSVTPGNRTPHCPCVYGKTWFADFVIE